MGSPHPCLSKATPGPEGFHELTVKKGEKAEFMQKASFKVNLLNFLNRTPLPYLHLPPISLTKTYILPTF